MRVLLATIVALVLYTCMGVWVNIHAQQVPYMGTGRFWISDVSYLDEARLKKAYMLHDKKYERDVCYLVVETYSEHGGVALAMMPRVC